MTDTTFNNEIEHWVDTRLAQAILEVNGDPVARNRATEITTRLDSMPAIVVLTQADYDGISTPDEATLYIIVEE